MRREREIKELESDGERHNNHSRSYLPALI